MKKFISCLVLALSILMSCNSDNDSYLSEQITHEKFDQELNKYANKQSALLSQTLTRASVSISQEEVLEIAETMDANFIEFYKENSEILLEYAKKDLSEDEIDLITLDETELLSFIEDNYSQEVYNIVFDFLTGEEESIDIQNIISNDRLNPIEKIAIVNLKNLSDFRDLSAQAFEKEIEDLERNNHYSANLCDEELASDLTDCALFPIAGTIVGFFTGGGTAIMGFVSYAVCSRSAYKSYKKCVRNSR